MEPNNALTSQNLFNLSQLNLKLKKARRIKYFVHYEGVPILQQVGGPLDPPVISLIFLLTKFLVK